MDALTSSISLPSPRRSSFTRFLRCFPRSSTIGGEMVDVFAGRGELSLRPVTVAGDAAIVVSPFAVSTSDQSDKVVFLDAFGRRSGNVQRQVSQPSVPVLAIRFAVTPRVRAREAVVAV